MKNLIAHRGLKEKEMKENSLKAFEKAIENPNYVGFECDIRTTKDHVFVVNHNPMIDLDVISMTNYQELKEKYNIPTLESVLSLNTSKIMLLEIKEMNIDISSFQALIQKFPDQNIYVMSFYNKVIHKLKKEQKKEKIGVLNYLLNSENSYQEYDFICLLEDIISPDINKYFQEQGIRVFIYGIHNLEKTSKTYSDAYYITDEVIA